MKAHIINKVVSGFSTILSLILLSTCIWILISLLINNQEKKRDDCQLEGDWKYDDGSIRCPNRTNSSFDDEQTNAVIVENEELPKLRSSSIWTKFDEMNSTFHWIIITCLSLAIVASLVQLICSGILIFSSPFRLAARSRNIVAVLFVAFVIFLASLAWPLAYKRDYSEEENPMHTISTLSESFKKFVMNFELKNLIIDFQLYYILLFVNMIYLFFYMVITCCLLRFTNDEQYDI